MVVRAVGAYAGDLRPLPGAHGECSCRRCLVLICGQAQKRWPQARQSAESAFRPGAVNCGQARTAFKTRARAAITARPSYRCCRQGSMPTHVITLATIGVYIHGLTRGYGCGQYRRIRNYKASDIADWCGRGNTSSINRRREYNKISSPLRNNIH